MGKARVSGWAVTLALLTAACSSQLPASGPTSEAILDRANSPDASVNFNYVLIDVTDPVINALATRPTQSLEKTFGIGGPAPLAGDPRRRQGRCDDLGNWRIRPIFDRCSQYVVRFAPCPDSGTGSFH